MFWQDAHAVLRDFAYEKFWLGFVFVPKLVKGIEFALLSLGAVLLLFVVICQVRQRKNRREVHDGAAVAF